jgi:tellurite methyltransferase
MAAEAFGEHPADGPRFAVDLGCGAGRDTRELLRRGWRVLATDMTPEALNTLRHLTPEHDLPRLQTELADLAEFEIPQCDLVNANLILPFLPPDEYDAAWERIRGGIGIDGRFSGMLFGHRDDAAGEPGMTCPSPEVMRRYLDGFEIEHWTEKEEDGETALGEPHHFHLIEVVAVRRALPPTGHIG